MFILEKLFMEEKPLTPKMIDKERWTNLELKRQLYLPIENPEETHWYNGKRECFKKYVKNIKRG
jgi:hypothetical protein